MLNLSTHLVEGGALRAFMFSVLLPMVLVGRSRQKGREVQRFFNHFCGAD